MLVRVARSAEPRVQVGAQRMEPWALKAGTAEELSSELGTMGGCLGDMEADEWETQLSSKEMH